MGNRILTVDDRSRVTLGTKLVEPGQRFISEKKDDGTIVLTPIRIERW